MKMETMYQEIILDHYRSPHHKGLREPFDAEVHHVNPTCGDEVTLRVRVTDGVVEDVSYDSLGCSISQASTSVMTDLVVGKPVEEGLAAHDEFLALMQSRGEGEPDEDVLEDAVADAHAQGDLVATGGVDVVDLGVERLAQTLVVGAAVVVQDDLLVHRLHVHRKNLLTCSSPSTSASTSPGVE